MVTMNEMLIKIANQLNGNRISSLTPAEDAIFLILKEAGYVTTECNVINARYK